MSNEKMRVLDLLESGKITAADAAMLLESLGKTQRLVSQETRDNVEDKLQRFAQDCSKLAKEVGDRVHVFYKGVEPKIKKVSQTALEKVACTLEDLACSISESLEKAECCEDETCCCNSEADTCTETETTTETSFESEDGPRYN